MTLSRPDMPRTRNGKPEKDAAVKKARSERRAAYIEEADVTDQLDMLWKDAGLRKMRAGKLKAALDRIPGEDLPEGPLRELLEDMAHAIGDVCQESDNFMGAILSIKKRIPVDLN